MKRPLLGGALACAAVTLCACVSPTGAADPDAAIVRFERAVGMSVAAYCTLPEPTRQAIRNDLTSGLTVITCGASAASSPVAAAAAARTRASP